LTRVQPFKKAEKFLEMVRHFKRKAVNVLKAADAEYLEKLIKHELDQFKPPSAVDSAAKFHAECATLDAVRAARRAAPRPEGRGAQVPLCRGAPLPLCRWVPYSRACRGAPLQVRAIQQRFMRVAPGQYGEWHLPGAAAVPQAAPRAAAAAQAAPVAAAAAGGANAQELPLEVLAAVAEAPPNPQDVLIEDVEVMAVLGGGGAPRPAERQRALVFRRQARSVGLDVPMYNKLWAAIIAKDTSGWLRLGTDAYVGHQLGRQRLNLICKAANGHKKGFLRVEFLGLRLGSMTVRVASITPASWQNITIIWYITDLQLPEVPVDAQWYRGMVTLRAAVLEAKAAGKGGVKDSPIGMRWLEEQCTKLEAAEDVGESSGGEEI
jgi:hypothetical protein